MEESTDRLQDAAHQAGEAASDIAGSIRDKAGRYAEQGQQYAKQGYDAAVEQSRQAREFTENYVKENPWYAVGIALGVGILIGLVSRPSR